MPLEHYEAESPVSIRLRASGGKAKAGGAQKHWICPLKREHGLLQQQTGLSLMSWRFCSWFLHIDLVKGAKQQDASVLISPQSCSIN